MAIILKNNKSTSNRSFGLLFTAIFAFVALWLMISGDKNGCFRVAAISAAFLLISIFQPVWLQPLNSGWIKLSILLHKMTNPIVIGVIFILAILPVGLLLRLFGKDTLRLQCRTGVKSYWIERRPPGPLPNSLLRQF